MRKIVKTLSIFLIIMTISTVIFLLVGKSYATREEIDFETFKRRYYTYFGTYKDDYGNLKPIYGYAIGEMNLINTNYIYCAEHGAKFHGTKCYNLNWDVEINGNIAVIHRNGTTREVIGKGNNLMAAILCESEGRSDVLGYGYGFGDNCQYQSQLAMWDYWGVWLNKIGIFSGTSNNLDDYGISTSNQLLMKYANYADQKTYSVKIYYFSNNNSQDVIFVERGEPTQLGITVEKEWIDGENKNSTRKEIEVELLANDTSTGNIITLNEANGWKGTFNDIEEKDDDGNKITYTIKELNPPEGYKSEITQDGNTYIFKITNTLLTEVKVVKQWDDKDNTDEVRPSSLKVTLYSNGTSTGRTVTLDENNNWTAVFENLNKYDINGKEIDYTVQEETIDKYAQAESNKTVDNNGYITWTLTNKYIPHYDGYIEISGKVWVDKPDGKGNNIDGKYVESSTDKDSKDELKEGVTVRLKYIDENGRHQLFNPNYPNAYETKTNSKGEYTIKVNYDNSQNVYKLYEDVATVSKKLETAYIEFEYDGMKYTTVAPATAGADTSRATEIESTRTTFDGNHATVEQKTTHPDSWTDKNITAVTDNVVSYGDPITQTEQVTIKYCNGNGTYIRTNPDGAWLDILPGTQNLACNDGKGHEIEKHEVPVQKIVNINLGLFEREQPKVAIFSDISKVEVEMNKQKYTYIYGVRGNKLEAENGIQTKFQNKDTYTYRRPVNPADIAYLQEVNKNAMDVYVTYEISVANLSNTLTTIVDNIVNYYDSNYKINSDIIFGTMNKTTGEITGTPLRAEQVSKPDNKGQYNEIVLSGLGIELTGTTESKNKIYIRYQIDQEKLPELFNNTPPLNNATEILSYATKYGKDTLYAEQRTGERTNNAYAGYDYNSHPGNAGIFINGENRLEANKPEDDTDIAPAFVLCKDEEKVLAGTVWEDTDIDNGSGPENFRLGDGKKSDSDKTVANVKIELYKVNDDGTTTLANLYKIDKTTGERSSRPAVAYSNNDGYYSFGNNEEGYGVVTDTYLIKFTYGKGIDDSISSTINGVDISGRDYKSTIISPETELYNLFKGTSNNEQWHLNISNGYSIAVDEMDKRIAIDDLQYSNFNDAINMTAYSKPFKMQVEFDPSAQKTASVLEDGKTMQNSNESFKNELSVFDFGIIERSREDIFVQKTIDYLKVTLANGQVLIEGNPSQQDLNYVKAIGYKQKINNVVEARNALEKQMLIEIDSELMQGAQLELRYAINVVNNSEKDYDYYVDNQIKTEYYYFGTNDIDKSPIITSSVNYIVDYVDSELVYTWEDSEDWSQVNLSDSSIEWQNFINDEAIKTINSGKYTAYITTQFSELAPGNTSQTVHATAKKLLANKDENVYENHIEIIQIDAKTARTIEGKTSDGTPTPKQAKPGNYVPSLVQRSINDNVDNNIPGKHEQDDDVAKLIITPPTGETNRIITYIIAVSVGLLILSTGIIYIKKKILS